jgi:uncharacterized protein (DUF302 family)
MGDWHSQLLRHHRQPLLIERFSPAPMGLVQGFCIKKLGISMYYIVPSNKTFTQASTDLEAAVLRHGFGVLHIHDLGATLRNKGMAFEEECKVFEVCNPAQAAKVLAIDMRLNMALPCRISVFTEKGLARIGIIRPVPMLTALSQDTSLLQVAQEVEEKIMKMVDEAK